MRMKRKSLLLLVLGLVFLVQAGGIAWSQVTERVSVDTTGSDADSGSSDPSTSSSGRYVAFQSDATDLVAGGSNGSMHIFVRDRQTETTAQISVDSGGNETLDPSRVPSISGDGMHVAFESDADLDLVAGDANPFSDIFVRDLLAVTTTLVSVDSTGAQDIGFNFSPSVSSNGRYVAFQSDGLLVFDDTGVAPDIFVHDRDADGNGTYDEPGPGGVSTVRVSVRSDGTEADQNSSAPSISSDGRYVAFESFATNLVAGDGNGFLDVFVHDRDADGNGKYDEPGPGGVSTVRVSVATGGGEANGDSNFPSISSDGRYVAFESFAPDLVAGDTNTAIDIFVHDLQTGATTRVSRDLAGVEGNDNSNRPSISADGTSVTFQSDADNLVGAGNDNNGAPDIFADDLQAGAGGGGGSDSSGGGCFISTAADGSGMAGEVK